MNRTFRIFSFVSGIALAGLNAGCEPGGVGDPCTPEDEYQPDFSGFSVEEVNVESRSFQCETRICLVNHFQGRVSCPYGNDTSTINANKVPPEKPGLCRIPGSGDPIQNADGTPVAVDPQIYKRQASDSVYCSCRCDGPDSKARYCECPSGFACVKLVDKLPLGKGGQLAGSYCIREGSNYVKGKEVLSDVCLKSKMGSNSQGDCGKVNANGEPE